jgi:hypothetical protein
VEEEEVLRWRRRRCCDGGGGGVAVEEEEVLRWRIESSIFLHIVLIMFLLLCAHFHRRNHTTATGSACSGDNATTSCAVASTPSTAAW